MKLQPILCKIGIHDFIYLGVIKERCFYGDMMFFGLESERCLYCGFERDYVRVGKDSRKLIFEEKKVRG